MDRYIQYDYLEGKGGLHFAYEPTRKDIERTIIELIKEGKQNVQVVKTRYAKCTCKKCGDTHQNSHESIDETFNDFIKNNTVVSEKIK